jgi:hypothetical protein
VHEASGMVRRPPLASMPGPLRRDVISPRLSTGKLTVASARGEMGMMVQTCGTSQMMLLFDVPEKPPSGQQYLTPSMVTDMSPPLLHTSPVQPL